MRTRFKSEDECQRHLERLRWPQGLACPHCRSRRVTKFIGRGKTGKKRWLYNCLSCHYQYTVTVGTFLHDSHVPLRKWLAAIAALRGGPKFPRRSDGARRKAAGIESRAARGSVQDRPVRGPATNRVTAARLQRELKLGSYETAWRLAGRIRRAQQHGDRLLRKILDGGRQVAGPRRHGRTPSKEERLRR